MVSAVFTPHVWQTTDRYHLDLFIYFLLLQPQVNHNEWRLLFFISFLLLVGFFVLNMFVGVVVENFHKCRESQEKEEKARRAAKRAKKLERKRRSMNRSGTNQSLADMDVMSLPSQGSTPTRRQLKLAGSYGSDFYFALHAPV